MELALIRHGRPRRWTGSGPADPSLDPTGVAQAERLRDYLLSGEAPEVDAIYSSPMARAKETAEIVGRKADMPVTIVDDLAEYDYGLSTYVANEDYEGDFQEYWDAITRGDYAGTHIDLDAFRRRVARGLDQIRSRHEPDAFILVFCHGGVINASIAETLGLEDTIFASPGYASISRLLRNPNGRPVLLSYNETPDGTFEHWARPGRIV